jgi:hypothetical protein
MLDAGYWMMDAGCVGEGMGVRIISNIEQGTPNNEVVRG